MLAAGAEKIRAYQIFSLLSLIYVCRFRFNFQEGKNATLPAETFCNLSIPRGDMTKEKIMSMFDAMGFDVELNGNGDIAISHHGFTMYASTEENDPYYARFWAYVFVTPKAGIDDYAARKLADHFEDSHKGVKIRFMKASDSSFHFRVTVENLADAECLERFADRILEAVSYTCFRLREELSA